VLLSFRKAAFALAQRPLRVIFETNHESEQLFILRADILPRPARPAVPYDSKFENYYLTEGLEAAEYPVLIKPCERICTFSVPTDPVSYSDAAPTGERQHSSSAMLWRRQRCHQARTSANGQRMYHCVRVRLV